MKTIVLGGGCFWCIEAVFQRVKGVEKVVSGYAGGDQANPTYQNLGNHAEVVEASYDEHKIELPTLLDMFFYAHDPTMPNRQGNDIGSQYRSIILYADKEQYREADAAKQRAQKLWDDPIVTEIKPLETFYPAEDYHQDYFNQNPSNPYCQVVINPKLAHFKEAFAKYLN